MISNLRKARKKTGIRLIDAGRNVGVSESTMSLYERGKRKLPVPIAKRLAKMYGVKWEIFYEDEEDGKAS